MTITRPKMILFDYGGTLLCEPEWDMLRGERAIFEHIVANIDKFFSFFACWLDEISSQTNDITAA